MTPSTEVRVLAWNYGARRYDVIGRTRSGTSAERHFGGTWYGWRTTLSVESAYWEPGVSGAAAKFRTQFDTSSGTSELVSLAEDPLACNPAGRDGDLSNLLLKCSSRISPELVVCTEDYAVRGSRRSDCSRRMVKLSSAADQFDTRLFPSTITASVVRPGGVNYVTYRGDRVSFIDVFQRSLDSEDASARLHSRGIEFSKFIRLYYTEPNTSILMPTHDLRRLGEGFARLAPIWSSPDERWDTGRSVRIYDRGECSVVVTWQNLVELFSYAIETQIARRLGAEGGGSITADADSNAVLEPILRTGDSGDAFHFFHRFYVSLKGVPTANVRIGLAITAAFRVTGGVLSLDIEYLNFVPTSEGIAVSAFVDLPALIAQYKTVIKQEIERDINSALGMISVVPISRVYARPEGFEIVLVEEQDVTYGVLNATCRAVCTRNRTTGPATFLGNYQPVFDIPPKTSHPFIVEDNLPLLKLFLLTGGTQLRVQVGQEGASCIDRTINLLKD